MFDSILINTPVSSPLHAQLNLPLLKRHLTDGGFSSRVIDANILFFNEFIGRDFPKLTLEQYEENPLNLLSAYNDIEHRLYGKSKKFVELQVGMRSLGMRYDRVYFDSVISAISDVEGNPFLAFWDSLIESEIAESGARIVGIAITFQDQIIPAFTLAARLRKRLPGVSIVLGGQIVTRCYDTMIEHPGIMKYADYLALWDGEEPILNIHRKLIGGDQDADLSNVYEVATGGGTIDRVSATPPGIPSPDFSDLDFNDYFLPEMLIPLQTTRGCYAHCAFCAIPFGSNKYQVRTADKVIDDIVEVQELTLKQTGRKATFFKFMEDTSSPSLLKELSARIIERKIDAKWETFARLEEAFAKPGLLEQLYKGGCRKIHWGLESNDPDILTRMNKKTTMSSTDEVLRLSAEAGILNFCFILVGFPGESDTHREALTRYICDNRNIHTLTIATFDLTRKSPMEQSFEPDNIYGLQMVPAEDFQVRLPYLVHEENWKPMAIKAGHKMMIEIMKKRPDIGFVTLFPDQIRSQLCDKFGNEWGSRFVEKYGENNVKQMLLDTELYVNNYADKHDMDPAALPEPLRREHLRTKEDTAILTNAIISRKLYERRRINQI